MDIQMPCEKCHRVLGIPSECLGKQVQCGACGHLQTAQEPPPESAIQADKAVTVEPPDTGKENRATDVQRRPDFHRPRRPFDEEDEDDRRFRRIDCPYCQEPISSTARGCRWCGKSIDPYQIEDDLHRLQKERMRENLLSFAFGVPGLALAVSGNAIRVFLGAHKLEHGILGLGVMILGAALLVVGGIFYAKYKGQHPALGLLILTGCIGLIVLLVIKDRRGGRIWRFRRYLREYQ
jgi:hypothetical protein